MTISDRALLSRPLLTSSLRLTLLATAFIGAAAFAVGLMSEPTRAWTALLVNFLFWGGLGQAGVVFSAIFTVTSAKWVRPLKRVAEATIGFLPVSGLLLLALFAGLSIWAPWVRQPIPAKQAWLNAPFFMIREALGFLLLGGLSAAYVRASIRPDAGMLREAGKAVDPAVVRWCLGGWRGLAVERDASQRVQGRLAPMLLIAYGYVFSMVAFDFFVSLDPRWVSTLAGAYFFVGNLYVGVAFFALAAICLRFRLGGEVARATERFYDIGRIMLGFCMLWGYLFWTQYLVIWFGDLPEETGFIVRRTVDAPWAPLSWVVLFSAFALPFVLLLSRDLKRSPKGLATVAVISMCAMWLERFVLVAPSLWKGESLPLGPVELLVTLGVGSLFLLSYTGFLQRIPLLPVADPRLDPRS